MYTGTPFRCLGEEYKMAASIGFELQPGRPLRGSEGHGGTGAFVGWVLVQVWEPTDKNDGIVIQSSGDRKALFERAAQGLAQAQAALDVSLNADE